ncbi:MAG: class I SAM-dependent methyltransferase [Nitrospirota bacterium]
MPHRIVGGLLDAAGVHEDDLLYDLGCGDGRVVIRAAQERGCRAVGIDSNPERIKECNENAQKAGVSSRVRFIRGDLFEAEIGEATVVVLYLLSLINVKLRPRLFETLRPGTRVISYEFDMGGWQPDQEHEVEGYPVYVWSIPAGVAGAWECSVGVGCMQERSTLKLEQQFQHVFGALHSGSTAAPLTGTVVEGTLLQLTAHDQRALLTGPIRFSGRVEGDAIRGAMAPERALNKAVPWSAKRLR